MDIRERSKITQAAAAQLEMIYHQIKTLLLYFLLIQ